MAVIGYYSMQAGSGTENMADDIKLSGNEPLLLDGKNWDALGKIDTLYVWNGSNKEYDKGFLEQMPRIAEAIKSGMNMVVFDRAIGNADPSTILPGPGLKYERYLSADADLTKPGEIALGGGPAPDVNDKTIDGGNYTTHGFVYTETLPKGATVLMTPMDGVEDRAVGFVYPYGAGQVQYYGVPMDFYNGLTYDYSNPWQNLAINTLSYSVMCLAEGTLVATAAGPRAVEALRVGDLVQTVDHGLQPLRWMAVAAAEVSMVEIPAGLLGNRQVLTVSAQHRILLGSGLCDMVFGADEVLIPARALVEAGLARTVPGCRLFNPLFDRHEIIVVAGGAPVESLLVTPETRAASGRAGRSAMARIADQQAARLTLTKAEAVVLLAWHARAQMPLWAEPDAELRRA